MDGARRLSLVVGVFVLAALAALAVMILSLSQQQGVFSERYTLVAHFNNVQGLLPNAPVWLAGTRVGRVGSVEFGARGNGKPALEVVLQIDGTVRERIRTDSRASIGTVGLLGDRYVEVSLGTESGTPLASGDELRTIDPMDLSLVIDKGAVALDEVAALASNLNVVVEQFDEGRGGEALAGSVSAMSDMVMAVQQGDGLLHSLIYDNYEGGGVESIENSLATLERILNEIASGDGVLHTLIYDAPSEQDIVLEAIAAGSRLNSILEKMDRGEGTMGMLLNDPSLYEDLKRLLGGAERSAVVRTLIRMSADAEE
jgi:phospholipid/cholesterol/gamma-HCH transport system substrate-binding protein